MTRVKPRPTGLERSHIISLTGPNTRKAEFEGTTCGRMYKPHDCAPGTIVAPDRSLVIEGGFVMGRSSGK